MYDGWLVCCTLPCLVPKLFALFCFMCWYSSCTVLYGCERNIIQPVSGFLILKSQVQNGWSIVDHDMDLEFVLWWCLRSINPFPNAIHLEHRSTHISYNTLSCDIIVLLLHCWSFGTWCVIPFLLFLDIEWVSIHLYLVTGVLLISRTSSRRVDTMPQNTQPLGCTQPKKERKIQTLYLAFHFVSTQY